MSYAYPTVSNFFIFFWRKFHFYHGENSTANCFKLVYEPADDEPEMNVVNFDIGPITQSDIKEANKADPKLSIINFNQPVPPKMVEMAKKHDIKIYTYSVIYHLMDDIRDELADMMPVDNFAEEIGVAKVKSVFQKKVNPDDPKQGSIAGCEVVSGKLTKNDEIEIHRNGIIHYTCNNPNLNFKANPIDEVSGGEFGCSFDWEEKGFLPGDILKCISKESIKRELQWEWD